MKLDTLLRSFDLRRVGDLARRYEEMGFDAVWSVEAGHDPFLPLAHVAAATETIRLGTNVAVAFARSPMSMAQVTWDLQRESRGRLLLGLGTQVRAHVERRYSMPFEHPAARITDYIRCLHAIWHAFQTGEKPDYRGRFYQFTLMNPVFNPGPIDAPEIPIHLAGVNARICRAAGEVADGFHVHPMHTPGYLREVVVPAINDGARTRGKTVADLELYSPVFVVTGDTTAERDQAEQIVRQQISFYASTPSYRALLAFHGFEEVGIELSALARCGEWFKMPKRVPDALVELIAVVAKPSELARALRQRYDGVLDRISLYFPFLAEESPTDWKAFLDAFRAV
jgi:probable F420-dependent oxidoreductase